MTGRSSPFQSRAFQISRDWRENTLAPTQCCHVVTDHKPKPLPPCCFALGTCVLCCYFIGTLVERPKEKEKKEACGLLFTQRGKTSSHSLPTTFLVFLLRAGLFPSNRSSLGTEHFQQTQRSNQSTEGGRCVKDTQTLLSFTGRTLTRPHPPTEDTVMPCGPPLLSFSPVFME